MRDMINYTILSSETGNLVSRSAYPPIPVPPGGLGTEAAPTETALSPGPFLFVLGAPSRAKHASSLMVLSPGPFLFVLGVGYITAANWSTMPPRRSRSR